LINLGIYRLAWHAKSISPWSKPAAEAPPRHITDLLPIIGWFGLRREAPLHGRGFWIRPMLVELLCGAAFALLYWWETVRPAPPFVLLPQHLIGMFPGKPNPALILATIWHEQYLAHVVLFCFMMIAFWIDFDEMTIPDGVTIPGTLLGLAIVTLFPYALLPAPEVAGANVINTAWLTSPDLVLPETDDPGPMPMPVYLQPWKVPAVTGGGALVAAIACFWVACLALVPGHWSTRHGYMRAMRVFTARVVRERETYLLITLAAIGSIAIAGVWWIGGPHWAGLATGLAGLAVGGALTQVVRIVASAAMGREAMGFGDATLLAMIGAYLGWQATIVIFFMAPLYALLIGIGKLILRGEREIPFGPFLCLAAGTTVVFWPAIWTTFEQYFGLGWKLLVVLLVCLLLMPVLLFPIRWIADGIRRATGAEQGAASREHGSRSTEDGTRRGDKRAKRAEKP
jgi:prepilin signal peptidase PulO-like enzyme (type II secretory pathway)